MSDKGSRTKERILTFARKVAFEDGFEAFNFQSISDACGMSQGAVFYHFKSKAEILRALVEQIDLNNHRIVQSLTTPEDGAEERLKKYFEGNLLWSLDHPDEAQFILLHYYFAHRNREFDIIFTQGLSAARLKIYEILLAGQREKVFRPMPETEAKCWVEILHDALTGSLLNISSQGRQNRVGTITQTQEKWQVLFQQIKID